MDSVNKFVDGIERLLKSNVITAGKDVRAFLIELSEDDKLRDVVKSSSEGFRYPEEFKRVFIERNPLPTQDSKKVALITGLMYSIDLGKVSLGNMLYTLYPDCDGAKGYSRFMTDFIQPYAESFVKLLVGEPLDDVRTPKTAVYDKMNDDIVAVIDEIIAFVSTLDLEVGITNDVTELASGLKYTLTYNDALLTRNAYLGLQNTVKCYGIGIPKIEELRAILTLYGVL